VRKGRQSDDELQQAQQELTTVLLILCVLYVFSLAINMHLSCSPSVDVRKMFLSVEIVSTVILRVWRTS